MKSLFSGILAWIIHGPRLPQTTTIRSFIVVLRSIATKDLRRHMHEKTIALNSEKQSKLLTACRRRPQDDIDSIKVVTSLRRAASRKMR
jgi:hypothetical protein